MRDRGRIGHTLEQLEARARSPGWAGTVLTWVQTFGPLLAKETDRYRRRLGRRWYVDELFLCRGGKKHYLYRAVDQRGQVVDVLLRERRDLASAEAFFRRAVKRWVLEPDQVVSDLHQPYVRAVKGVLAGATHIRTSLHRRRGETACGVYRWASVRLDAFEAGPR